MLILVLAYCQRILPVILSFAPSIEKDGLGCIRVFDNIALFCLAVTGSGSRSAVWQPILVYSFTLNLLEFLSASHSAPNVGGFRS